eukprot:scaffold21924_cov62-Phaeocystis_antarctica.AAC.10
MDNSPPARPRARSRARPARPGAPAAAPRARAGARAAGRLRPQSRESPRKRTCGRAFFTRYDRCRERSLTLTNRVSLTQQNTHTP